jgi:hypothetical protein
MDDSISKPLHDGYFDIAKRAPNQIPADDPCPYTFTVSKKFHTGEISENTVTPLGTSLTRKFT